MSEAARTAEAREDAQSQDAPGPAELLRQAWRAGPGDAAARPDLDDLLRMTGAPDFEGVGDKHPLDL